MVAGGGHASGSAVLVTTVTFTVLAGMLTIARIYTRMKITHNTGVDDYLVAFAMVSQCTRSDEFFPLMPRSFWRSS